MLSEACLCTAGSVAWTSIRHHNVHVTGAQRLTQHQQQIGKYGPNQRGCHDCIEPFSQRHNGENELHHVSEGSIEQATHSGTKTNCQILCDFSQNEGQGYEANDILHQTCWIQQATSKEAGFGFKGGHKQRGG